MNRLQSLDVAVTPNMMDASCEGNGADHPPDLQRRSARHMMLPQSLERTYAYPLLVWLHGGGANERQLLQVMPHVSLRNFASVAPRGDMESKDTQPSGAVCYWRQTPSGVETAWERVQDCIGEAQQRLRIAPKRIFIAGFADGGTMALRLAFAHPEVFHGAASLNGPFPRGDRPFRRFHDARSLALFLAVGRESRRCEPQVVADDLRLLHTTGTTVMLCQYEADDLPTTVMFADLNCWLMDRVTGSKTMYRSPSPRTTASDRN